jgi:hypothetical protein
MIYTCICIIAGQCTLISGSYYIYSVKNSTDIKAVKQTTYRGSNCDGFASEVSLLDASVNGGCSGFFGITSVKYSVGSSLSISQYTTGDCTGSALFSFSFEDGACYENIK